MTARLAVDLLSMYLFASRISLSTCFSIVFSLLYHSGRTGSSVLLITSADVCSCETCMVWLDLTKVYDQRCY